MGTRFDIQFTQDEEKYDGIYVGDGVETSFSADANFGQIAIINNAEQEDLPIFCCQAVTSYKQVSECPKNFFAITAKPETVEESVAEADDVVAPTVEAEETQAEQPVESDELLEA